MKNEQKNLNYFFCFVDYFLSLKYLKQFLKTK